MPLKMAQNCDNYSQAYVKLDLLLGTGAIPTSLNIIVYSLNNLF